MRIYVELINQRYDEGEALGKYSPADWRDLLKKLEVARRDCGVETSAEKATSFETGDGKNPECPASVVYLLDAVDGAKSVAPLLKLRAEVEEKGGILRVLKTEDLSKHVEDVANVLSGEHGFERVGAHFACVAGDGCGLKVYQGDPGYAELTAYAEQSYEGGLGRECETNDCEEADCHRCFPRTNCPHHEKCRSFTAQGDSYDDKKAQRLAKRGAATQRKSSRR